MFVDVELTANRLVVDAVKIDNRLVIVALVRFASVAKRLEVDANDAKKFVVEAVVAKKFVAVALKSVTY